MMRDPMFSNLTINNDIKDHREAAEYVSSFMHSHGIDAEICFEEHLYVKDEDDVFLIVDRDSKNRPKEKYCSFVKGCVEQGFLPVVTNPCFELWLLMHYEGCRDDLEAISMDRNPFAKMKRCMSSRGMEKKNPDYQSLIPRLNVAMTNAEGFIYTPEELESKVGTNMPDLIHDLRNNT